MGARAAARGSRMDLRSARRFAARSQSLDFSLKRLGIMSDTTVLCRNNGPYWIIGDFKLVDAEGNPIEIPENKRKTTPEGLPRVALCRCGGSVIKPFCDGTHSKIGFVGAEEAVAEEAVQKLDPTLPSP